MTSYIARLGTYRRKTYRWGIVGKAVAGLQCGVGIRRYVRFADMSLILHYNINVVVPVNYSAVNGLADRSHIARQPTYRR
jgi:hypothetical protein